MNRLRTMWKEQNPRLLFPLSLCVNVVGFALLGFHWMGVIVVGAIALTTYDFSRWVAK